MAGGRNTTGNCSVAALRQCSSLVRCSDDNYANFHMDIGSQMWQLNAMLLVNAVLAGVMVGIGGYGQRYRHHPFTRFIFIGATTLSLPVISYLASSINKKFQYILPKVFLYRNRESGPTEIVTGYCELKFFHVFMVNICAFLVQITVTNTSVVVARDNREGKNVGPPLELIIQGVWVACISGLIPQLFSNIKVEGIGILLALVVLCGKMMLKYYAFGNARKSFAFGCNPRLILGYMQQLQLQERSHQHGEEPTVGGDAPRAPPLLVMGEEKRHVEKVPQGCVFKDDYRATTNIGLSTIDKIWLLDNVPQRLKDVCLSFALFKLLRCRFARYHLSSTGSKATTNFFWSLLLEDDQHDRVFRVTEDELSFVHDYYYSSLPISYSKCWLPIFSIFASLLSIGCLMGIIFVGSSEWNRSYAVSPGSHGSQMECWVRCSKGYLVNKWKKVEFGWQYFDIIPATLLVALVFISEVRDIISYICSNWTKVALICRFIDGRISSNHPISLPKWASLLLQRRCKMMKHWDGKMNQCSVLASKPGAATMLVHLTRLLRLPDQKRKAKLSTAVKVSIIDALRSCNSHGRRLSNGTSSLRQSQVGESFLSACNGKGTSDIILVWHVATCMLEVRYPQAQGSQSISDNKIVATHLSQYCAYLMAWYPELLPDDDAWSKGLYDDVKKDAVRVLAGGGAATGSSTPETEYQNLVARLSEHSNHEVLKSGVKLGTQLAELMQADQEPAWKLLAGFWSEMILYVAPSDNLKGHSEAIARGGELITLLWAMLFHAGIVNRPTEAGGGAVPAAVVV